MATAALWTVPSHRKPAAVNLTQLDYSFDTFVIKVRRIGAGERKRLGISRDVAFHNGRCLWLRGRGASHL